MRGKVGTFPWEGSPNRGRLFRGTRQSLSGKEIFIRKKNEAERSPYRRKKKRDLVRTLGGISGKKNGRGHHPLKRGQKPGGGSKDVNVGKGKGGGGEDSFQMVSGGKHERGEGREGVIERSR